MSSSSSKWYVEMSVGITLGPMPFADLVELAQTAALMRNDRVRKGTRKPWRAAHEVAGLFDEVASETPASASRSLPADAAASTGGDKLVVEVPGQSERAPADDSANLGDFRILPGSSDAENNVVAEADVELARALTKLKTADVPETTNVSETTNAMVPPLVTEAPELVAAESAPALQVDGRRSEGASRSGETGDSRRSHLSGNDGQPENAVPAVEFSGTASAGRDDGNRVSTSLSEPPAVNVHVPHAEPRAPRMSTSRPAIRGWTPPVNRRRRLLCFSAAVFAGMITVASAFWLLQPDYERDLYGQYVSLYEEYQRVSGSSDDGSWREFATRARAELDESIPLLEASSGPGDRGRSLLLYAARDLREALGLDSGSTNPHEKRLQGLFDQLSELHASVD